MNKILDFLDKKGDYVLAILFAFAIASHVIYFLKYF